MRFVRIALLALCVLLPIQAQAADSASKTLQVIGQTSTGQVIWYGHELRAPHVITVDPTGPSICINGQPIHVAAAMADTVTTPATATKSSLCQQAREFTSQLVTSGVNGRQRIEQVADVFQRADSLVDMVRIVSDDLLAIHWIGDPDTVYFEAAADQLPNDPLQATRDYAAELNGWLEVGCLIIFGDGEMIIAPAEVPMVRQQIAALRQGQPVTKPFIRSPLIIEQLRHPVSTTDLLERGK